MDQYWSAEEGRVEADRRIRACLESASDTLDIGGLALDARPEALGDLSGLRRLYAGTGGPATAEAVRAPSPPRPG